jgi:hypothetical protein
MPIGLPPDFKKVVGDYESSTVVEGEDAVNRKFAPVGAVDPDLAYLDFWGVERIRGGGELGVDAEIFVESW